MLRHPRWHTPRCRGQDTRPWDSARPISRVWTTEPLGALTHVGASVQNIYTFISRVQALILIVSPETVCPGSSGLHALSQWVWISSEQRTCCGSRRPMSLGAWRDCPGEPKSCRPSASGIACKGSKALGTLL